MEANEKTILVTWDFSNVSEYALQHAIRAAKRIDATVTLLHITSREKENEEAAKQLQIVVEESRKRYSFVPKVIVKEGSIFTTIAETANELGAIFVVMGTHGMKGMQKITGSWALKVIAGAKMPFLVVQQPPKDEQLAVIAYPVDFKKEDKQKSIWAVYLHKYFKSKICMFVQKPDDQDAAAIVRSNVIFTKNMFDADGVNYEIEEAKGNEDNFSNELIEFAERINANAILITTTKNVGMADYMFGATEQQVIANKEAISVMCVNPKEGRIPNAYL